MTDQELADAVVALGVGLPITGLGPNVYRASNSDKNLTASEFVRDWRVAGALMEKQKRLLTISTPVGGKWWVDTENDEGSDCTRSNESLPRAIIEACVEALSWV